MSFVKKMQKKCWCVLLLLLKALETWSTGAQHAINVVRAEQGCDHDEQLDGHEHEAHGPAQAEQVFLVQVVLVLASGQDRHGEAAQVVGAVEGCILVSTALQLLFWRIKIK